MNVALHCLLLTLVACVSVATIAFREEISERADLGLLVAVIAAVSLAVAIRPVNRFAARPPTDLRISAASSAP